MGKYAYNFSRRVGLYSNCWCKSCFANLGHSGWVVLFKTDHDFKRVAQGPWINSIVASTLVCLILWIGLAIGTKKYR